MPEELGEECRTLLNLTKGRFEEENVDYSSYILRPEDHNHNEDHHRWSMNDLLGNNDPTIANIESLAESIKTSVTISEAELTTPRESLSLNPQLDVHNRVLTSTSQYPLLISPPDFSRMLSHDFDCTPRSALNSTVLLPVNNECFNQNPSRQSCSRFRVSSPSGKQSTVFSDALSRIIVPK